MTWSFWDFFLWGKAGWPRGNAKNNHSGQSSTKNQLQQPKKTCGHTGLLDCLSTLDSSHMLLKTQSPTHHMLLQLKKPKNLAPNHPPPPSSMLMVRGLGLGRTGWNRSDTSVLWVDLSHLQAGGTSCSTPWRGVDGGLHWIG